MSEQQGWTERLQMLAKVDLLGLDSLEQIDDTLAKIVEIGNRLVPSDKGISIIMWDEEKEKFTLSATSVEGLSPRDFSGDTRCRNGVTRWIIDSAEPYTVRDINLDPFREGRRMKDHGVRSYMGVPIQFDRKAIGVLFVFNGQPKDYSDDEILLCKLLANRAASAIRNANYMLELKRRATRDGLTGLLNRVAFFEVAEQICKVSRRHDSEITVMFVDVDDLKQVNDTHGHLVGDRVLQAVGRAITSAIREMDIAARYGGDEFVILFPETAGEQVGEIRQRIVSRLDRARWGSGEEGIGVSMGYSAARGVYDVSALVREADAAMYEAKREKRS